MRTELRHNIDIQNKINQLLDCKNILILGSKNSGKTSIALNYALHGESFNNSFFFTSQKKEEVYDKAIKLFPELQPIIKSKLFIYQAPITFNEPFEMVNDKILSDIIMGILQIIEKNNPDKIVFDEITPFLAFLNLDQLKEVFQKLLCVLEQKNITGLFTIAEPVSQRSIKIVDILKNEFVYHLNLKTNPIF